MKISKITLAALALIIAGCAYNSEPTKMTLDMPGQYLKSGTVILSRKVPKAEPVIQMAKKKETKFAPLLGYFPPDVDYAPADNENWLEINAAANEVNLRRGDEILSSFKADGIIPLIPGQYYLQHKETEPVWYAPDKYFERRQLAVPGKDDALRYRRGALGEYALYPTSHIPIHSAPIWSDDVGGLRLSKADLSAIYHSLPVGAPIVVK